MPLGAGHRRHPAGDVGGQREGSGPHLGPQLAQDEPPPSTSPNPAARSVWKLSPDAVEVAATGSVISTSLFGSAPWSPPPLTVEVMAQMLTVPSGLTRPVMLRSPSVAGDHGSFVAALIPVRYPGTV